MGVPFEALLPYAIMIGVRAILALLQGLTIDTYQMFGFSGAAVNKLRHMQNEGKRTRHSIDQWDRQSASNRDSQVTLLMYGQ